MPSMSSRSARREQTAESLLVAAGERRDPNVKAETQWRRLPTAARETARAQLNAWYGGSYRGRDLSAGKTRRARLTFTRRATLAASGVPTETQPTSAAGVDRAYRTLEPARRQAAEAALAEAGPVLDLDSVVPTVTDTEASIEAGELSDAEAEALLAGEGLDELGELEAVPTGLEELEAEPSGELSDAEAEALLAGADLADIDDTAAGGGATGPGHWWGDGFESRDDVLAYMADFDWAAIAEARWDGYEWRVWFPDDTP
jgi:hypothetical protein